MTERITIAETAQYVSKARKLLSDDEQSAVVELISRHPEAGILLDGGLRKLRFAARGKGKSGGVRVIYYFGGVTIPVYLLTVFGKNEKDSLSAAEMNDLKSVIRAIRTVWSQQ